MAPVTVTETCSIKQTAHNVDNIECKLTHNGKDSSVASNNHIKKKLSPYDEIMKSHIKEPKWFTPIRQWEKRLGFVTPIRWINTIMITLLHVGIVAWVIGGHLSNYSVNWQVIPFGIFVGLLSGFGVTGGAHRYWCHRSYKARWPLKIILVIGYSMAGQNTIFEWVRDHRVHHKHSETTADPHDANRGFFFSHVGWLMMKKHPDVIREGNKIDMSDIINDPFVQFHTKYFILFKIVLSMVVPSLIPIYAWGERWEVAVLCQGIRYILSLNFTWSVNSFAHLWGNKPYDKHIMPSENWGVSSITMGEGWHNYHHTFPWDYKAAELGVSHNSTTLLLNLFAWLGWAYDLKSASPSLVQSVAMNRDNVKHVFDIGTKTHLFDIIHPIDKQNQVEKRM